MKLLIIGSGGREHALAWKLRQCPEVSEIVVSPGNPGIAKHAKCIPTPASLAGYVDLAEAENINLTVVGPEAPLVAGIVDLFRSRRLKIVGPTQAAARLEGSKVFAKDFFRRAGIPTARSSTSLDDFSLPVVIKADGLAAGKGVSIATTRAEAEEALTRLGPLTVIEEFLCGTEISFIALCDGNRLLPFAPTQDHKRAFDGDRGPNTGGMGAYCDLNLLSQQEIDQILERVMFPALRQMAQEGAPFTGFLYAGLMMTAEGPKVLEFNVRLGDPETQALMMSLRHNDLASVLIAAAEGKLPAEGLRFGTPSTCVVLAALGYPDRPITGQVIEGLEGLEADENVAVFQAGTTRLGERLIASGGRVLGVTARGGDLSESVERAYSAVSKVHFEGMHYRRDIGRKGTSRC